MDPVVDRGARAASAILAAALLFVLALAHVCCGGGPGADVRQQLDLVNDHLEQAAEDLGGIQEIKDEWESLASSSEITEQTISLAVALLGDGQSKLTSALESLSEAAKDLQAIQGLEISEEMSRYVDMKLDALDEQKRSVELQLRAMVLRAQAFAEPESENLVEKLMEYRRQIEELEQQAASSAEQARKMHIDANDYYDEKIGS